MAAELSRTMTSTTNRAPIITAVATPLGILIATLLAVSLSELALAFAMVLTPAFRDMGATRDAGAHAGEGA